MSYKVGHSNTQYQFHSLYVCPLFKKIFTSLCFLNQELVAYSISSCFFLNQELVSTVSTLSNVYFNILACPENNLKTSVLQEPLKTSICHMATSHQMECLSSQITGVSSQKIPVQYQLIGL